MPSQMARWVRRMRNAWLQCSLAMLPIFATTARADDGLWAIYVMRPDGSEVRKVAQIEGYRSHGSPRFSHDGTRLAFDASGGPDNASKCFVVNLDGSNLQELGEHATPDWSPDDKQIIYTNYGRRGAKQGTWVQNLDGQGRTWLADGVCARWNADGSRILCMDQAEHFLSTVDLAGGEERRLHDQSFARVEPGFDWSADGKKVAVITVDENNQRNLLILTEGSNEPRTRLALFLLEGALAFSPDARQLVVSISFKLHLLDVAGNANPKPIPGQIDKNWDPHWSPDGKWIAFASDRPAPDPTTQVVVKPRWKLRETARHTKGSIVYSLAYTPDGSKLVMGGDPENEGLQIWDWTSGETKNLGGNGITVCMFPDGKRVATSWLSPVCQIIDLDSGDPTASIRHGETIRTIAVSKDGAKLVTGGFDRKLNVWDTKTEQRICSFEKHDAIVTRAVFSPDGKRVISAGQDKVVRIWDAATGQQLRELEHPDVVWGLAVTPDGAKIITGTGGSLVGSPSMHIIGESEDNQLRIWDAATGAMQRSMKGHTHVAYTIDVSPDGRLAASGGWEGSIVLWDLETGQQLDTIRDRNGSVLRVTFSPDGRQLAVGGGVSRTRASVDEFPQEQVRLYRLVNAALETIPDAKP